MKEHDLRRTVTDLSEQLDNNKKQLQDTEGLIRGEKDLVEVNTGLKKSLTLREEKQESLQQEIDAGRQIAEKERLEKEEAMDTNADLLKKILQLSLSKLLLMKKVEKYEQTSKKSQSEQESVKQIITYVLSGQIDNSFLKEVGGIKWSELKVKRQDPNFDHMSFWKALAKEDQATLMELLKEEQDDTKPTDQHQHWANALLSKIEVQKAQNEKERKEREAMILTNQRLSQQIEETKDLQQQTVSQQKKLKEKDKIIQQLVKAQVRASMTIPSTSSQADRNSVSDMVNAGSFISDSGVAKSGKGGQIQVDASDSIRKSSDRKPKKSSKSSSFLEVPDDGSQRISSTSPRQDKDRKRDRSKDKKSARDRSKDNKKPAKKSVRFAEEEKSRIE